GRFPGGPAGAGAKAQTRLEESLATLTRRCWQLKLSIQIAGKGSGEGRVIRPRSRHCNRLTAVSQATLPCRGSRNSSREGVAPLARNSRAIFVYSLSQTRNPA